MCVFVCVSVRVCVCVCECVCTQWLLDEWHQYPCVCSN